MREQWFPSLIWSLFHAIPNSHSCRRTLEPHFLQHTLPPCIIPTTMG